MDTRTKKRIRARMARTGETYQAALNATCEPAKPDASAPVLAPNPHPFELVCDLCGETVLDDPQHALITWFYLPDPPFEYVAGLYIAHKGACDDLVQLFALNMEQSTSWIDLMSVLRHDWYAASRSLFDGKRWCPSHEERLTWLFRRVSAARERGWRPPAEPGYDRHGPPSSIEETGKDARVDYWVRSMDRKRKLDEIDQREPLLAGLAQSAELRANAEAVFEVQPGGEETSEGAGATGAL